MRDPENSEKKYDSLLAIKSDKSDSSIISNSSEKSEMALNSKFSNSSIQSDNAVMSVLNTGKTNVSIFNVGESRNTFFSCPDKQTAVVATVALVVAPVAIGAGVGIGRAVSDYFYNCTSSLLNGNTVDTTSKEEPQLNIRPK